MLESLCCADLLVGGTVGVLGLLYYFGFFHMIRFIDGIFPKRFVYGIAYRGSFNGLGAQFSKLEKILEGENLKPKNMVGIYYDDPKTVKEEELRSFVGAAFEEELPIDVSERLEAAGLKFQVIEPFEAFNTYFPFRNMLSYFIAPMMVYPKCDALYKDYSPDMEGGLMEMYHSDSIQFIFPKVSTLKPVKEHWE
eukprot:m.243068 g.243068  ORF g.243068 m.243068 type:complete len:194 (-) comp40299_c0_seq1:104-685(-)